jgi:hypothetical protein
MIRDFLAGRARAALAVLTMLAAFLPAVPASADGYFECIPDELTEFSDRIHVRCTNGYVTTGGQTIRYLAISKTDTARAQRFITLANSAMLSGQFFLVLVTDSASGNVAGCGSSDCRSPTSFGVRLRP